MSKQASDSCHQALETQWVEIDINASPMQCYIATPKGEGPWPAVIVLMEIFGVNSHIQQVAERLAAEGYVAIAPNYYHRTTENLELSYTDRDVVTGRKHKEATTREGLLVDLRAIIQFLQAHKQVAHPEKIGCVGFCFGGHVAYIAAGMKEIVATAAFYPGGVAVSAPGGGSPTVTHAREIQGEILCFFGEEDPLIPHQDTVVVEKALKEAGVRHEVIRYSNTGHGFFCNQRQDYDPSAAEDAWRRVKALFAKSLHPQKASR